MKWDILNKFLFYLNCQRVTIIRSSQNLEPSKSNWSFISTIIVPIPGAASPTTAVISVLWRPQQQQLFTSYQKTENERGRRSGFQLDESLERRNDPEIARTTGVNFTYILQAFLHTKVFFHSFSLITVMFCQKNIGTKAACKMLVKLTTEGPSSCHSCSSSCGCSG